MFTGKIEAAPALMAALAKAQGEFAPIPKNRSVTIQPKKNEDGYRPPAYTFRYSDLEAILAATRPALSKNGLSLVQPINPGERSSELHCWLMHSDGAVLESRINLPSADARDPKQYGSLITYLRRYLVASLLGIASDDDLDEDGQDTRDDKDPLEGVGGASSVRTPKPMAKPADKSAAAEQGGTQGPAADQQGDPLAGKGEHAWLEKKIAALGISDEARVALLGRHGAASLETMTQSQFRAIKTELMAV